MTFRNLAFQMHKILGLTTGVVVFIVAITGCCWVFRDEILSLRGPYTEVTPQEGPAITPTRAREIALETFPGRSIHGALFGQAGDPVEVIFYEADPEFYRSVYLHPSSGEVLHTENHLTGFFAWALKGHMRLWLPRETGEQVVGISILIFLLMLLSGIVLWMPRKRANLGQRLRFSWKPATKWKRKNFDLHSIVGFYVCLVAFLIAFTGSIMSYQWLKESVHSVIGGEKSAVFAIPPNVSKAHSMDGEKPVDRLLGRLREESRGAASFEIHFPYSDLASIYVETSYRDGIYYNNDYRFFDARTLEEIESPSIYGVYEEASAADKLMRMNYDIHVGAIGGLPGKIIAFLASLLVASLPVTGTLIWYGRTFKKKRYSEKVARAKA